MRRILLGVILVLIAGCQSGQDTLALKAGKASGVLKDAKTITLPLDDLRQLEGALYDRQMDSLDMRETICATPAPALKALKLPGRYCADLPLDRETVVDTHRKARRILDAPDLVEADAARIIDLLLKALGAAAKAAK